MTWPQNDDYLPTTTTSDTTNLTVSANASVLSPRDERVFITGDFWLFLSATVLATDLLPLFVYLFLNNLLSTSIGFNIFSGYTSSASIQTVLILYFILLYLLIESCGVFIYGLMIVQDNARRGLGLLIGIFTGAVFIPGAFILVQLLRLAMVTHH